MSRESPSGDRMPRGSERIAALAKPPLLTSRKLYKLRQLSSGRDRNRPPDGRFFPTRSGASREPTGALRAARKIRPWVGSSIPSDCSHWRRCRRCSRCTGSGGGSGRGSSARSSCGTTGCRRRGRGARSSAGTRARASGSSCSRRCCWRWRSPGCAGRCASAPSTWWWCSTRRRRWRPAATTARSRRRWPTSSSGWRSCRVAPGSA